MTRLAFDFYPCPSTFNCKPSPLETVEIGVYKANKLRQRIDDGFCRSLFDEPETFAHNWVLRKPMGRETGTAEAERLDFA
jgi:hypothetical protein